VGLSLKAKPFFDMCKEMAQVFRDNQILLPRPSNSLQYREGHEVFSVVTCPVERGTYNPCGSVNKLALGIKHSSNESLTL
jgi:hypothetical protein